MSTSPSMRPVACVAPDGLAAESRPSREAANSRRAGTDRASVGTSGRGGVVGATSGPGRGTVHAFYGRIRQTDGTTLIVAPASVFFYRLGVLSGARRCRVAC